MGQMWSKTSSEAERKKCKTMNILNHSQELCSLLFEAVERDIREHHSQPTTIKSVQQSAQVVQPLQHQQSEYEAFRVLIHGCTTKSYIGWHGRYRIVNILQDELSRLLPSSHIRITYKDECTGFRGTQSSTIQIGTYFYLSIDGGQVIVDGSYRALLLQREKQQSNTWMSAYAEYVFNLPPIFVGSVKQLQQVFEKADKMRRTDILYAHTNATKDCHDPMHWFRDPNKDEVWAD